jgi:hypothetical protein
MTCQSCHKVYIGQTGRKLTGYKNIRNIRFNKEESAFAQHILGKGHQYGPMEQIMEMTGCARKGNIMNIKENCYIYQFKQLNELIEEQKGIKENDNQKSMFDIVIGHVYTPTRAPQGTRVYDKTASKRSRTEATEHHSDTGRNT